MTFNQFLNIVKTQIELRPNYDLDDETFQEFQNLPSVEIGKTLDNEGEFNGIYLSMGSDFNNEFYNELYTRYPLLIPILQQYLEDIFSENTNNDACSFQINFETEHGTYPSETNEIYWTVSIIITDYLS